MNFTADESRALALLVHDKENPAIKEFVRAVTRAAQEGTMWDQLPDNVKQRAEELFEEHWLRPIQHA